MSRLYVVLHGRGEYIFVDEIIVDRGDDGRLGRIFESSEAGIVSASEILPDSTARLSKAMWARYRLKNASIKWLDNVNDDIVVWDQPAWDVIEPRLNEAVVRSRMRPKRMFYGFPGDIESWCVGIYNRSGSARRISISVEQENAGLRMRLLAPVVAANGRIMYDAIRSIDAKGQVDVLPSELQFLWFDVPIVAVEGDSRANKVSIRDGERVILSVELTTTALRGQAGRRARINTWAYYDDVPIWSHAEHAAELLHRHGVNVSTIHHKRIPMPTISRRWDIQGEARLREALKAVNDDDEVLLYLNWSRDRLGEYGLPFLDWQSEEPTSEVVAAVTSWLARLKLVLRESGVQQSRWALYPVDEPTSKDVDYLRRIVKLIKSIDRSVRIYINPTFTPGSLAFTSVDDLRPLAPYVDIWQPRLELVKGHGSAFYQGVAGEFWIYENPPYPAKAAEPLRDYMLLGWEAWARAASGFGVWSFSDTWQTSAWNDFDGHKGDWAMAYETPNGQISSRRLEALRAAAQDYRLLGAAESALTVGSDRDRLRSMVRSRLADGMSTAQREALRNEIARGLLH